MERIIPEAVYGHAGPGYTLEIRRNIAQRIYEGILDDHNVNRRVSEVSQYVPPVGLGVGGSRPDDYHRAKHCKI